MGQEGRAAAASTGSEGFFSPEKRKEQVIPSSLLPSTTPHGGFHLVGEPDAYSPHHPLDQDLLGLKKRLTCLCYPGAQHRARLAECGDS